MMSYVMEPIGLLKGFVDSNPAQKKKSSGKTTQESIRKSIRRVESSEKRSQESQEKWDGC